MGSKNRYLTAVCVAAGIAVSACGAEASEPPAAADAGSDQQLPQVEETVTSVEETPAESQTAPTLPEPSETVFPPPPYPAPDSFVLPPADQIDRVGDDPSRRQVLMSTTSVDGEDVWATAWANETESGAWVYCIGTSHNGHSCVPDGHGVVDGFQIRSTTVESPGLITFITDPGYTSLQVAEDLGSPVSVDLVDLGLPSGYLLGAYSLSDDRATQLTFSAQGGNGKQELKSVLLPALVSTVDVVDRGPLPLPPFAPQDLVEG